MLTRIGSMLLKFTAAAMPSPNLCAILPQGKVLWRCRFRTAAICCRWPTLVSQVIQLTPALLLHLALPQVCQNSNILNYSTIQIELLNKKLLISNLGDFRVVEQSLLSIMHTLWLREHNRVANILFAHFGTAKSDEYYYQETRRIVIAEFQHIVYNEYLTVLVGMQQT